jgi:peptidyl-prolyl cis-trans isomerase SurA
MSSRTSLAALGLVALLAASPARAVVVDGIAAVVNGEVITLLELEKAGRMAVDERLRAVPAAEQDRVRREVLRPVLDQLVLQRLQAQRARALGIQVSEQEVDNAIGSILADNHLTPELLDRFLAERGATREEYRREIRDQIALSKVVQQEIRSRVTVSEEEVQAYFKEHGADWNRPERVRVRHILVPVPADAPPETIEAARQKAAAITAEARQGADFAKLVRGSSPDAAKGEEDPVSGELARGELTPELELAAFSLPVGGVSDPVRSAAGFHVLQVASKIPPYRPAVDEVRMSIEQKIGDQKSRAHFDAWLKQIRQDAIVDVKY